MTEYNDYPFEVIAESVAKHRAEGHTFHQKWTCRHCGSRQSMGEANTLYRSGRCEECKQVTIIEKCNFLLIIGRTT